MTSSRIQVRLPLAQILCECAGGLTNQEQASRGNNHLATGDQHAASRRAIPDADIAVSCILPDNIGNIVDRHAKGIRQARTVVQQSHLDVPQRARGKYDTNFFYRKLQNCDGPKIIFADIWNQFARTTPAGDKGGDRRTAPNPAVVANHSRAA